jgi:hypothetical protein
VPRRRPRAEMLSEAGHGARTRFPGDRRLRTKAAEVTSKLRGGRKRLRQERRGAANPRTPRMIWRQSSMSSGTKIQAFMSVRALRCGLQTCRVAQMSEVTSTLFARAPGQIAYWVSGGFPFTNCMCIPPLGARPKL